jgi:preprotein translocase subunit SecE
VVFCGLLREKFCKNEEVGVMGSVLDFVGGMMSFFRESSAELKKVTWPSTKQVKTFTVVVIGLTAIVSAYLGLLDFLLTQLISRFFG